MKATSYSSLEGKTKEKETPKAKAPEKEKPEKVEKVEKVKERLW